MVASLPRKLDGNRACGRDICPGSANAFSAGIKCQDCRNSTISDSPIVNQWTNSYIQVCTQYLMHVTGN